ncbi:carbamoyl phosphate synthase small subunit [Weissella diestrammenae]|uniref:Carbamoyl phosphate synthase small chain n=1 Tax=Weissella diestrammenae TaxID=1162633 RepID=A0A7G9T4L9_9LACO|nr:carbamoyl phosphate synthase small subunit [Weissella diestrammenae]MCM0582071.1 carbamoyl phosphate synthase small subunit [Weissella diestrammenae]QNN75044.1 carbamoyl phosphate synthase small subunit [Weissella diestrammenae]
MVKRYLILQDKTIFEGEAFGAPATTFGEIVFNTSMTGYQEIITNPIYHNQIVMFTTPTIGAAGINHRADEGVVPTIKGVVAREIADVSTNRLQQMSLDSFLQRHNIPGISRIDTRALARHLRQTGTQKASIVDVPDEHAFDQLNAMVLTTKQVSQVSTPKPYANPGRGANVVILDFGLKNGILRNLRDFDANVTVLPYNTTLEQVVNLDPDGVVLSSGPGDPRQMSPDLFKLIQAVQAEIPLLGIGFGHELFALANGAKLIPLNFEHHGMNHPIREQITGKILFANQGAGYAIDRDNLAGASLMVTHVDLMDNSIQGLRHRDFPAFGVQFFPDAAPGPYEATDIFAEFMEMVSARKGGTFA